MFIQQYTQYMHNNKCMSHLHALVIQYIINTIYPLSYRHVMVNQEQGEERVNSTKCFSLMSNQNSTN